MMIKGILIGDYNDRINHKYYPKGTPVLIGDQFTDNTGFYGPPGGTILCCVIYDENNVKIPSSLIEVLEEHEAQEHQDEDNNDGQKKIRYEVAKGVLHDILTHKDVLEMIMGWTDGPDGDAPNESDIARISVNIANAFISKINE